MHVFLDLAQEFEISALNLYRPAGTFSGLGESM